MMIRASWAGDDDDAAFVRLPVDELFHARRTFFAREGEKEFWRDSGQGNSFVVLGFLRCLIGVNC